MTTKSKAKQFVLLSGTHSRVEGDRRVRYIRGDLIEPTAAELAAFPDKFLPIEEFEARLAAFENQQAKDAQFRKAAALNAKKGNANKAARSPEAKKRGERLLEMGQTEKRLVV